MSHVVLPGATIGVLGSGQLGRMFAIAARKLGYRVHTLSPDDDTPTGQVADREWQADYGDLDAVRRFAAEVDVMTFEFENVPSETAAAAAAVTRVRPDGHVLHVTQNRLREKSLLREEGIPVTPFWPVRSLAELETAVAAAGCPAVLKTAGWGYDGKGQVKLHAPGEATAAWQSLGSQEAILEAFIDYACEASIVVARGLDGQIAHFGLIRNEHRQHILDVSVSPAGLGPVLEQEAAEIARAIVERLDVVGVLCVEFFITRQGRLLVNELAPRPHNSGHLTFDAFVTCQFEQQLRAICGLPLGSTERLRPAAMVNLLGDLWTDGEPPWQSVCAFPEVKLHLYGKLAARPGRKMGHLTALAESGDIAKERALQARAALRPSPRG
ncbi:MAG: 5-(carboxyamino)imidazole ribonucleotide synthase [Pirellulales bacterium]|nr:5-(carboxyamino)imidazole ribonucleotide synthase [Pirellulales bacterium]